ncbi:MAG: hypothetical protein QOH93_3543 [Chloroflexia bacterium]|jgi:hypothetical protein|nr:hypothetical protein [Chloroflexia bacterium]
MVSLRRVSLPLRGTERLRRAVFKPRPPRLSKAERKLEEALDQLRNGVPLNWLQMEDDPELVTLACLYGVARQAYRPGLDDLPPHLHEETLERLSKRMPAPKPQPAKQTPKSLAGFSENVTVLTQAEEDLPQLATTAPQMAVAVFVTAVLVTLLALAYNFVFPAPKSPYTWIEVRQNSNIAQAPNLPKGYKSPICPASIVTDTAPFVLRNYADFPTRQKAQENVDFLIQTPPDSVAVGRTEFSLGLVATGVAPCDELGGLTYSSAKLSYLVRSTSPGVEFQLGQLSVFEVRQQVVRVDNTNPTFRQVTIGDRKGVVWESESYRDYSNALWLGQGPITVMVLEKDEIVTTFVGQKDKGITEEMLTALIQKMDGVAPPTTSPQASTTGTPASNIALPIDNKRTRR